MLLWLLLNLLSLGFIPIAILSKKKKIRKGIGSFSALLLSMSFLFANVSVSYHQIGNEKAFQECLDEKTVLVERKNELLEHPADLQSSQRLELEIQWHNKELEQNRAMSMSLWWNWFSYASLAENFDSLYIGWERK